MRAGSALAAPLLLIFLAEHASAFTQPLGLPPGRALGTTASFSAARCAKRHAPRRWHMGRIQLGGAERRALAPKRAPLGTNRRPSSTAARMSSEQASDGGSDKLPASLNPICLAVFVQMLGEGIAISTIPLHLSSFGATPIEVGLATSAFSLAQMVCCPLIVGVSTKIGRTKVLRICLAGATVAALIISLSSSIYFIIFGRFLAGVFASSVPVAQAGVTDIVPGEQSALALSRVASVAQLAIVVGPAMSALCAYFFEFIGVPTHLQIRSVFAASGLFALAVLALNSGEDAAAAEKARAAEAGGGKGDSGQGVPSDAGMAISRLAQPMLRAIALVVGWSLTLSVSTYCLLGASRLGYAQPQLSATFSAGAAITVATQLFLFPSLVKLLGEHVACTAGLAAVAAGLAGCSTFVQQPLHSVLYFLNRAGSGVADTATATLVARSSKGKDERSQNLALIQSTRAFARIFTPLISGTLFARQTALPYYVVASLATLFTPLPLLLLGRAKRLEYKRKMAQGEE
mmetsp:Transcript_37007/g.91083  ORF Transcript_37007/g.91083 Transcript_37007/m.91083 type:complete len:517 (+) Transcript_37007:179-1729(+)|eukprot:CAMPEP_0206217660 /NCGR_PEP_ID=MMETSP0047_2-20121206/3391_1 /ASSEMBLY_ACC=CAM_ASM_000192 /TAXON_ID=195065 /ORGANISM="Chroomonas mesostigmatica_cf, Strain CCMP1168" /LENGTH=516 /DNA_ID=CAMNT_0053640125 /DNA_START=99 /DNA_END=1649 /DNA_ORIENTATION=+